MFLISETSCKFCARLMALTTSSAVEDAVSLDIAVECNQYSLARLLLISLPLPPGRRPFRLPLVFLVAELFGLFFLARSFAFRSALESLGFATL